MLEWLRHLSWRLIFNIIAVIVWVLIRKLLELFGFRFQAVQFTMEQRRDKGSQWILLLSGNQLIMSGEDLNFGIGLVRNGVAFIV